MDSIREYEIAYVIDAQLAPEDLTGVKDKITDLAKGRGAEVGEITQWDRRRLAYTIKGKREGTYVFMPMKATAATVDEIVRTLKITEPVLRHLVIRTDED
jgi:small subunit ribosomal protein S6